jgi:hypothetical protein
METPKNIIIAELNEIAPFLGRIAFSKTPYVMPAGYFDGFTEILMQRIRLETGLVSENSTGQEIAKISPLLAGLQKKNPYNLPTGYFETWKAQIPESEKMPAKLIKMSMRSRVMRYAAVACIVALLGIAVFTISNHRKMTDPITDLANVSDQDMANYLDSDDIHWTPGISSAEIALVAFNDNDIHDLLSSVPDDELEQYSALLPEDKGTVN